jgi:hypothetical protein
LFCFLAIWPLSHCAFAPLNHKNIIYTTILNTPGPFLHKMKTMPMGLNSTPLLSYHDIRIKDIDLIDDAFGFNSEFHDVIAFLGTIKSVPGKRLTKSLIQKIRKKV